MLEEALGLGLLIGHPAKTDQTALMVRLVCVFARCTCRFVGFVLL